MSLISAPAVAFALLLGAQGDTVQPSQVTFLAGGDRASGQAAAEEVGGRWVKTPTKAFKLASKALAEGGDLEVTVRVASGDYEGDLRSGAYTLPRLRNAEAVLRIEGGWAPDFGTRDPFGTPTRFVTNSGRSQPMLRFYNSRPADQDELEALVIDGLVLDAAGSNNYDAETNSLLKRGSCTHVLVHFGYLRTDELRIQNCVFMNTAHRAFETTIRCASDDARVVIENNLFLNNLIPVKADTARYRHNAAEIVVRGNSFLLNWALNPDPGTSNPCALELGSADAADAVLIEGNLFYANLGGAIAALPGRLPALTLRDNNFAGNGLLHGDTASDAACLVISLNGRKMPLGLDLIEEVDAVEEAEGNVTIAPGLPLALGKVGLVDPDEVEVEGGWENEVRRMLGQNVQGGTVSIQGFAPRKEYDAERPPLPVNGASKGYGFDPARCVAAGAVGADR